MDWKVKPLEAVILGIVGIVLGYVAFGVFAGKHRIPSVNAAQSAPGLTPDFVTAHCGPPLNHTTVDRTSTSTERVFIYQVGTRLIVLRFSPANDSHSRPVMIVNTNGSTAYITDPPSQMGALPCLRSAAN